MYEPYVNELQFKTNYKTNFYKTEFLLKNNYYDCVCLITALHHIMNPDAVIDRIYHSLKKDGIMIVREH